MANELKTKESFRTQMGKVCQAYKSLIATKSLALIPPEVAPLVCPPAGVEQFQNDHFQTGDFTDWTQTNFTIDNGTCQGYGGVYQKIPPFLGSYDASAGAGNASLQQLLTNPVSALCLTLLPSVFQITYCDLAVPCLPSTATLRILYTDGTYTDVDLPSPPQDRWSTFDLKPYVQSGKFIRGILFTDNAQGSCDIHVGQVSLQIIALVVLWDDGVTGASNWISISDAEEVLTDDPTDKPDGVHQSMDITIGSGLTFDDYLTLPTPIDVSQHDYISLWWKGINGKEMGLLLQDVNGGVAVMDWTDTTNSWVHFHYKKSDFSTEGIDWTQIVLVDVASEYTDLTIGDVIKVAYITNDNGT